MIIETEYRRELPKLVEPPQQFPKTIRIFYIVLCLHSDNCFVFDYSNRWERMEAKAFGVWMPDTIYITMDPITALAKKLVTPEEIGVSASVLATVGLLTKG